MDGMTMDHGGGGNNGTNATDHGGMTMPMSNATEHGGMTMPMSMMHMTFFWGKNADILFSGWPGTRTGMYVLALIFVFLLALLVEWLSHSQLLNKPGSKAVVAGFMQSFVYTIRVGLAYLVMLAIMSFNGGVFLVAIAGHFVGYLVFGSRVFKKTETTPPLHTSC